ncbi:RNase adapter RapZ [Roseospirillum parvum]|uniref:UPF0042 nucleotide-binding protein n=1 Tax=Roseospirillum parvum TaxID=83401 RepID=A0A1G7ZZF9_9PROT|nr:RNase adapter RapZ [Roseospirillum parvum]SDH14016.1 UPF0042 nucleotide-binding protein [Roseospirillum parvum]
MSDSPPTEDTAARRVVMLTGLSGAGMTSSLKALEDLGFECVDNLPLSLLGGLIVAEGGLHRPLAVGVDVRTRGFDVALVLNSLAALATSPELDLDLLFLDCDDAELARRFTETRRRHPLAAGRPLADGIKLERQLMAPLKERADVVFDTSDLPPGELKRMLESRFGRGPEGRMTTFVTSFGFKVGPPREADLVFDVRFLNNPHYDPALKPLTGHDPAVGAFVAADPDFAPFLERLVGFVEPLLPRYRAEGKSYLTIAVGCTGGRHRSVFVAETLGRRLAEAGHDIRLRHRDLPTP